MFQENFDQRVSVDDILGDFSDSFGFFVDIRWFVDINMVFKLLKHLCIIFYQ